MRVLTEDELRELGVEIPKLSPRQRRWVKELEKNPGGDIWGLDARGRFRPLTVEEMARRGLDVNLQEPPHLRELLQREHERLQRKWAEMQARKAREGLE